MIHRILRDTFVRHNMVFFLGSVLVAALNYLFHPVMSRMLSVSAFGEVQVFISLIYITSIFVLVFRTVVINLITQDSDHGRDVARFFAQRFLLGMSIFCVLLVFLHPFFARALQLDAGHAFFPFVALLIISVPLGYCSAVVQGQRDFVTTSLINIFVAGGKLLFAVLLVFFLPPVFGAVCAFALASLVAFVFAARKIRYRLTSLFRSEGRRLSLGSEYRYGWLVFCGFGFVTFLYTSDVLFVQYFFASEESGLYSGIATVARIIFFATASIAAVLLPSIRADAPPAENRRTLLKALLIVSCIALVLLGSFFLFPFFIIGLLIGPEYVVYASLLPVVGFYIFLVSVINVFFAYFLALRDFCVVWISLVSLFVLLVGIMLFHGSFYALVLDYIVASMVALILIVLRLWHLRL